MKTIIIKLTEEEILRGASSGLIRRIRKLRDGKVGGNSQPKEKQWQVEIEGVLAEMAFNKWKGTYWTGGSKRGSSDAAGVEVRMTWLQSGGLGLQKYDLEKSPDVPYVLLAGLDGRYKICGWFTPREGVIEKYWTEPNERRKGYYLVPQEDLHGLETLEQI